MREKRCFDNVRFHRLLIEVLQYTTETDTKSHKLMMVKTRAGPCMMIVMMNKRMMMMTMMMIMIMMTMMMIMTMILTRVLSVHEVAQ